MKSSRIGAFAGLDNIEKLCAENKEFLQDPTRRKALADRILRAVSGITLRPETERLLPSGIDLSQSEVERRLSEAGITAVFRRNATGRLTGATFIDHTTRTVYNGSALDKKLSANNWNELFAENHPSAADTTTSVVQPSHPATITKAQVDDHTIIIGVPSSEQYSYFEDTTLISPRYEHDERSDDYEHYEYDTDPSRTTFRGLSHQSHTPEEIDPEFRTLHKRKKQRRKMR